MTSKGATDRLIQRFSSLYQLKKATAWMLRYKVFLLHKLKRRLDTQLRKNGLSVAELQLSEREAIKYIQLYSFPDVTVSLRK